MCGPMHATKRNAQHTRAWKLTTQQLAEVPLSNWEQEGVMAAKRFIPDVS